MTPDNRYSGDIFRGHARNRRPEYPSIPAEPGIIVEIVGDDFVGALVGFERTYDGDFVRLEDRHGRQRLFKMLPGAFEVEGQRVSLHRYVAPKQPVNTHSNSGSRRVENARAKVAQPSRIWVEGIHDAAIVQKVWGHDLKVEGVVVEYLEGLDNLNERLKEFQPGPGRRIGVLADHLIEGTKESRLVEGVGPHVLVTGHPYIDIWEAVKPEKVGLTSWPKIPYGEDWKTGVCQRAGWGSPKDGWRRVYDAVETYRDLDSTLISAVERLVDFVTNEQLKKSDC
ncbi:DUF3097 domain-containing protein [Corynebacterium sp. NML130628]|uniref:DUF3097 domain-containing protein n=1 Tax=Corynebacterium sp. NML130628 TaxID=1906333 RepID=UPI0008FB9F94|nr:DUF3097 domain-containing protein [Corynebacterium sp. NML130628]